MELINSRDESQQINGISPATIAMAVLFAGFCAYFLLEGYFLAVEFYAGKPPYALIGILGIVAVAIAFFSLRKLEPYRGDTLSYALLMGLGFMLFLYPLLPRVNIWLDDGSLEAHAYVLNSEHVWVAKNGGTPDLDLPGDFWWQQFEPGDEYTFNLRQSELGIWQINMNQVYDDQQQWGIANMLLESDRQLAQVSDY